MMVRVFPGNLRLENDDGSCNIPLGVAMEDTIAVVRDIRTHEVISSGVGELWLGRQIPGALAKYQFPAIDLYSIESSNVFNQTARCPLAISSDFGLMVLSPTKDVATIK